MDPAKSKMAFDESERRIKENARWIAGGVNSNFRLGISPTPLVFERAEGPYLFDADGNRLIDYYLGMGPMILGHSPRPLREAVREQVDRGILFAGQSEIEFEAARLVCERVPSAERMRFGSSGSEVVQAAIRLARAATGPAHDPEVRGPLPRLVRQHPVVDRAGPQRGRAGGERRSRSPAARVRIPRRPRASRCSAGTTSDVSKSGWPRETSPA